MLSGLTKSGSNRHSPDKPRAGANFVTFAALLQDRRAVPIAATILCAWTADGRPSAVHKIGPSAKKFGKGGQVLVRGEPLCLEASI
jgi:hypothetical protein